MFEIENGVVVDLNGSPLFWHHPSTRSSSYIPDSRTLWEVLWEHRDRLLGVAHSHPGGGLPGPSGIDLSTFKAIEAGLGKHIDWWITSYAKLIICRLTGEIGTTAPIRYTVMEIDEPYSQWLPELRRRTYVWPIHDPDAICDGHYVDEQGAKRDCATYEGCGLKACPYGIALGFISPAYTASQR